MLVDSEDKMAGFSKMTERSFFQIITVRGTPERYKQADNRYSSIQSRHRKHRDRGLRARETKRSRAKGQRQRSEAKHLVRVSNQRI